MEVSQSLTGPIQVLPYSWWVVKPTAPDPDVPAMIQCFGITSTGHTIYIRIPLGSSSTYVVQFGDPVDSDTIENLRAAYGPQWIVKSIFDQRVISMRSPAIDFAHDSTDATWLRSKMNPCGDLCSFFQATGVRPYEGFIVERGTSLEPKYTISDVDILAADHHVRINRALTVPDAKSRIYWDLETWSADPRQFSNPNNPQDVIFLASLVHQRGNQIRVYLLYLGKLGIFKETIPVIKMGFDKEEDLLLGFFRLLGELRPDRSYTYNGDNFDIPYIIKRVHLHKLDIPEITKIPTYRPGSYDQAIDGLFGPEIITRLYLPGTEQIDMVRFMRRFHPGLPNYRLDTVGGVYLGERKTGLPIPDLFRYYATQDEAGLGLADEYSIQDSLLLEKLGQTVKMDERLERIANITGTDVCDVIEQSFPQLVDRMAFLLDPSTTFISHDGNPQQRHVQKASPGLYNDITVYDFSQAYLDVMLSQGDLFAKKMAQKLQGAPSEMIFTAYYSKYVNRTTTDPVIQATIRDTLGAVKVIELTPFEMKIGGDVTAPWLKKIGYNRHYLVITGASYITESGTGEISRYGTSSICRPPFKIAVTYIQAYLDVLFGRSAVKPDLPTEYNLDGVVQSDKIKDVSTYNDPNSWRRKLAEQLGPIQTWIKADWVKVVRNKVKMYLLVDNFDPTTDKVDGSFYRAKMRDIRSKLTAIPSFSQITPAHPQLVTVPPPTASPAQLTQTLTLTPTQPPLLPSQPTPLDMGTSLAPKSIELAALQSAIRNLGVTEPIDPTAILTLKPGL